MDHFYYRHIASVLLSLLLIGCSNVSTKKVKPDMATTNATVSRTGDATFTSIQAAVDAAPSNGGWTISIAPGIYNERVIINKPHITLVGAGIEKTRITFGRYAGQRVTPNSDETWGTFRSATVEITHQGAHIANLTIENSFDFIGNESMSDADPAKKSGSQAVALKLDEYSDKTIIENTALLGYQDTLYVKGGRSYFYGGEIRGNVDFIFGDGNAYFELVDIYSRGRGKPADITGFVTAPSTIITDAFGFTFVNCRLLRENNVPDHSVPLGRPWHPTTTFIDGRYSNPFAQGNSTFINTWMDKHITVNGWDSMGGSTPDGGSRAFDPIEDARFQEYKSSGPGAVVNAFRPQVSESDILIYSRDNILDGWKPFLIN